jgi:transmembrane sensor
MDDLSERLRQLGGAVSETAERLTDPNELSAVRRMWLQSPVRVPARVPRPVRLVTFAVGACLAALLLVFVAARRPEQPVSFLVGAPPAHGSVGEWVAADRTARLPMRFSEGTSFVLAPGATARVTETTAHGATLLLERGDLTAEIVHVGAETRWSLRAGPFEVRVTGTKFDASWDPSGETFELAMREGAVYVNGPLLQAGRELRAGERLRVSIRDGSMELRTAGAVAAPVATMGETPSPTAQPSALAVAAPVPANVLSATVSDDGGSVPIPSAAVAHQPSWRELSAAGKYNEALAAAERAGFTQEIERASSTDLAALADAARYAARPALARQALLGQRRRFGARGSSAFVLGKIAADQQGSSAEAVRWFETYLQEEPNGALAEQALGRLLLFKKGDPAAARATAQRYLTRYPGGIHAPLARSLLAP